MTVVINGTTGIDTGTGSLISADSTTPTYLDLFEDTDNGSNYVRLIAPTSVASNRTITLPDGTGTVAVNGVSGVLVSGTAITLTNQTAPDFTGIPSWVKRITLLFNAVSTNGASVPLVQLGDAGGYETSGYAGGTQNFTTTPSSVATAASTGWPIQSTASTNTIYGALVITNISGNVWVISGNVYPNSASMACVNGAKTLSDTLTSVRLYIDGTQFFDAGTINIIYE